MIITVGSQIRLDVSFTSGQQLSLMGWAGWRMSIARVTYTVTKLHSGSQAGLAEICDVNGRKSGVRLCDVTLVS